MLSPDARAVAMDMLKPPAGYQLERTILTTYSLDLEVLLALPLSLLAHADKGVEELLQDPLLLLEALREAGEQVQVFVDEGGIAVPTNNRALYAALESSVHPVRAPNGGAFHPKVWVARFVSEDGPPLLRVSVASRNLTFDRCWDVAMASEATAGDGRSRKRKESAELAELVRRLPELALEKTDKALTGALHDLADELDRTAFPAPQGFDSPLKYHGLGLSAPGKPWQPMARADRMLAVAPFVNRTALDALTVMGASETILVSRPESLDALAPEALDEWGTTLVLSEAAEGEPDDAAADRPSGLHAKMLALEHGDRVSWFAGSANLTAAAFTGRNVEMMASVRASLEEGESGNGIDAFREAGFLTLCEPYRRQDRAKADEALEQAQGRLDEAQKALLSAPLKIVCRPQLDTWSWRLEGEVSLPDGVDVSIWPVSVEENRAVALELPQEWMLPTSRLSAFVAFRLRVPEKVDDVRFARRLPAEGIPDERMHEVLRALIDSPERFMQFLRALLGGEDALAEWAQNETGAAWNYQVGAGLGGEPLLEDLVRTASRDPGRLEPVRRLIEDLRNTEEGRAIVPDDLYEIWQVIDETTGRRGTT